MKRILSILVCIICLTVCLVGCKPEQNKPQNTNTPVSDSGSPSSSAGTTIVPETPKVSLTPNVTGTATPKPTAAPTIRPAQSESIVPSELLLTGYTTPLDPKSVNFPANYKMPYYIEVDVTNQCVNIFRRNDATGAYDILLNRFVCSGGTSTKPTKLGHFYIKSDAEQKKATGQNVKYTRYYFKNYQSYAYYVTRYSNEYMFHSFTFEANAAGQIVPKRASYYNMGNTGSAGCLRMLMNHAKWIYDNIDAGTYCVVNKNRPTDKNLRAVLKKYVPTLGYDMTTAWNGDRSSLTGLTRTEFIQNPDVITTPVPTPVVTPTPTPTPPPTPVITPTPTPTPTPPPESTPVVAPTDPPTEEATPIPTDAPVGEGEEE